LKKPLNTLPDLASLLDRLSLYLNNKKTA